MKSTPQKTYADPPGRSPTMKQELEQLRQRGLTKTLNKHFAQECKKVQAELAAAESALAELETRKANIQKFSPNSNDIANLDMMSAKLIEWRKQCRKNEQQVVFLYKSYVSKYAGCVTLASPDELFSTKPPACTSCSMLANADIGTLVQAFEKAQSDAGGIPDFLRPQGESPVSDPFNSKILCEILEDSSLPDPDAPCKTLAATPSKDLTDAIDSDVDDSSIVSGLTTLNSAVTREVLHEVETNVMDFIKKESEQIRKIMEQQDDTSTNNGGPSVTSRRSSSSVAEHEDMVKRMQQVLDDFKKAEEEAKKKEQRTDIRRLEGVGNPGEEWYQHFDETFQRHFYVEAKSNKTQWHLPQAGADVSVAETSLSESNSGQHSTFSVTPTKAPSYEEFMPQKGRRSKRVEAYRAKQRRRRKRQFVALAAAFCVLGAGAMYYKHTNPDNAEEVLESVVGVFGLSGSSEAVVEPITKTANRDKSVPSGAPIVEVKKKEIPTSSTPSIPVNTKKVTPEKNENAFDEASVYIKEEKPEIPLMDDATTRAFQQKEEVKVKEPNGLAFAKPLVRQNWLLDVFFGPPAFQNLAQQCQNPERYCGLYHF